MSVNARIAAIAIAVASGLLLSGCAPSDLEPSPTASPSSSPVFASEEEALAAAEEAYAEYQRTSDLILSEGGEHPDRIEPHAVGAAAKDAYMSFAAFSSKGYRSIGSTSFNHLTIQQMTAAANGQGEVVTAYVCVNVGGVEVVDSDGTSVVSPDRPPTQAYEVGFVRSSGGPSIVLSRTDTWQGAGVCE